MRLRTVNAKEMIDDEEAVAGSGQPDSAQTPILVRATEWKAKAKVISRRVAKWLHDYWRPPKASRPQTRLHGSIPQAIPSRTGMQE
jgi:hypothetical protein